MKLIKILFSFYILIILTSCGTLKKGFENQKKNSNDEFLVEKKMPLVMPPDYNNLPIPKDVNQDNQKESEGNTFKSLITETENSYTENDNSKTFNSLEDLLLDKIKRK